MKIQYGKRFENKTSKFLLPCVLSGHGNVFQNKTNDLFILAAGLDDRVLYNNPKYDFLSEKKPVFILVDKFINKRKIEDFLYWLKYQEFFLGSYSVDMIDRAFMIIVDTPEKFQQAYDNFIVGKYSEMYTKQQISILFQDKNSDTYHILTRNTDKLLPTFVKKLEETFETKLKYTDFVEAEMDLPYKLSEQDEVFNYELTPKG